MATFGGAGASALSDIIAIAFPITSGDNSIPARATLDQPTVETLLKQEVQSSPGWNSAASSLFAGLPGGLPFVAGLVAKMAEQFTGIDITGWLEMWNDLPVIGTLDDIVMDAFGSIFTTSANLQSIFSNLNFLDPNFDPEAAIAAWIELVLLPGNLLFGPIFDLFGGASTGTEAGSFFASLLGLLGNPLGMLTGSPTMPALSNIPLFGPVLNLFGGASTGTQATNFFSSLLGLLGNPLGMLTGGAPTLPSLSGIPLLGDVQTIVDGLFGNLTGVTQSGTGISDLLDAFLSIPASIVAGVGGPASIGGSFQGIIDQWISGAVGIFGLGAGLGDLFNVAQQVSSGSALGQMGWDVLSFRSNKPQWMGQLPTGVSNIPMPALTSSTAPTFPVTQSTAAMGYHPIDEGSSKGVVNFEGSITGTLTHFFVNIYSVDLVTGLRSLVHASPNIIGDVSTPLGSNIYTLNDGAGTNTPIPVLPGEVYGIEYAVRGAGTYNLVGAQSWRTFDVATIPKRMASVRNSGTSAAPTTITEAATTYSANIPFTSFAITGSLNGHSPELRPFLDAGTTSTVVPSWADFAEVVTVGSGGNGYNGSSFVWGVNGKGGSKGVWGTGLWTKGTHFAAGDLISITVALPGGATSSATVNGNTVSGTGGADGSGTGTPTRGESPGNKSYGTPPLPYSGGVQQNTLGADGSAPGGGGAGGGFWQLGGAGAKGAVWIRFRQDTSSRVVTPSPTTLTVTGGTPTITSAKVIQPAAASLTITGGQPAVGNTATVVSPAAASLAITGGQPTVTTTTPSAQFVSANAASTTSVSMPTHQAGDLLLMYAFADANVVPTTPATWWPLASAGSATYGVGWVVGGKVAASSSETSGTWSNADGVVCLVYRNAVFLGGAWNTASSSTMNYLGLARYDARSLIARFAGHRTATNMVTNTPAGYTARTALATDVRGMDSNGVLADATAQTQVVNSAAGYNTWTAEIAPPAVGVDFVDDFNTGSAPDWSIWNVSSPFTPATVELTGGKLKLATSGATPAATPCLLTEETFDFGVDGRTVKWQMGGTPASGATYYVGLRSGATGFVTDYYWLFSSAGASAQSQAAQAIVANRWYRLRKRPAANIIDLDYSDDNVNWTNKNTTTFNPAIGRWVWATIAVASPAASTGGALFDNFTVTTTP